MYIRPEPSQHVAEYSEEATMKRTAHHTVSAMTVYLRSSGPQIRTPSSPSCRTRRSRPCSCRHGTTCGRSHVIHQSVDVRDKRQRGSNREPTRRPRQYIPTTSPRHAKVRITDVQDKRLSNAIQGDKGPNDKKGASSDNGDHATGIQGRIVCNHVLIDRPGYIA